MHSVLRTMLSVPVARSGPTPTCSGPTPTHSGPTATRSGLTPTRRVRATLLDPTGARGALTTVRRAPMATRSVRTAMRNVPGPGRPVHARTGAASGRRRRLNSRRLILLSESRGGDLSSSSSGFPESRQTGYRPNGASRGASSRKVSSKSVAEAARSSRLAKAPLAPELSCRQRGSLRERFQLRPGDLWMDAAAETAVGGGDHALLADGVRESRDALGHELGMLDHVGRVTHDPGQDQLAVRKLHVLPYLPLVLVTHVGGLERVGATLDGQHDLGDVTHGNVGRVRTVPAAPAEMKPDPVFREPLDRVVERLNADHRELLVVGHRGLRVDHVPVLGDRRIIELQHEPSADDGLVFLTHRVSAREQKLLLGLVVAIRNARGAPRRDRGHEAFLDTRGLQRRLEVRDVGLDGRLARVRQLADAHRPQCGAGPGRDARVGVGVGGGEPHAVATIGKARQHHLAGPGSLRRHVVEPRGAELEPAQTLERVAPPRPVIDLMSHRLPELAVARNRDASLLLQAHDLGDARPQLLLEAALVARHARLSGTIGLDQGVRAWQTSGMASQDLISALPHGASSMRERGVGSLLDPALGRFPRRCPSLCRSYRVPSNFYLSSSTQARQGNRLEHSVSDLTRAFCAGAGTSRSDPRHPGRHPRCYVRGSRG